MRMTSAVIDPRPLAGTRIALGVTSASVAVRSILILDQLAAPDALRLPLFLSWEITPWLMALAAAWLAASIAYAVGWMTRPAGVVLLIAMATTVALDQQLYSNHAYLLWLLVGLSLLSTPGAAWSIDGRGRTPEPVAAWPVVLMCAQVSIVYIGAGLTKVNPVFLSGAMLARFIEERAAWAVGSAQLLSVMTPLVEIALGIGLWSARYRRILIVAGLGLHLTIPLVMAGTVELLEFSVVILGTYWLFPAAARAVTERSQPSRPVDSSSTAPA